LFELICEVSKSRQTSQNSFDPACRAEVLRRRVGFSRIQYDFQHQVGAPVRKDLRHLRAFVVKTGSGWQNQPRRRHKVGFVFLDTYALSLAFLRKNWVRFVISPPIPRPSTPSSVLDSPSSVRLGPSRDKFANGTPPEGVSPLSANKRTFRSQKFRYPGTRLVPAGGMDCRYATFHPGTRAASPIAQHQVGAYVKEQPAKPFPVKTGLAGELRIPESVPITGKLADSVLLVNK
jgi:hypothetical protein